MPFPIIVCDSRPPNMSVGATKFNAAYIPLSSVVYEFNPYEFGSYDARLRAFVNQTYLGTHLGQWRNWFGADSRSQWHSRQLVGVRTGLRQPDLPRHAPG